jgi:hypothetical protein
MCLILGEDGDSAVGLVKFEQDGQYHTLGLLVGQYQGVAPRPRKAGHTPAISTHLTSAILKPMHRL